MALALESENQQMREENDALKKELSNSDRDTSRAMRDLHQDVSLTAYCICTVVFDHVSRRPSSFAPPPFQLDTQKEEAATLTLSLEQAKRKIEQQDAIIKDLQEKAMASARAETLDEELARCREHLADCEVRAHARGHASLVQIPSESKMA
jgi:regulator of replication initiation timing